LLAQHPSPASADRRVAATPLVRQPDREKALADTRNDRPEKSKGEPAEKEKPRNDREALQGEWRVVNMLVEGEDETEAAIVKQVQPDGVLPEWTVTDSVIEFRSREWRYAAPYKIDPEKKPKEIDIAPLYPREQAEGGPPNRGIYSLEGDVWKVCFSHDLWLMQSPPRGQERPREIASTGANRAILITLKRVTPLDRVRDEKAGVWREKLTFKNLAPDPEKSWKPGGLFPAFVQFSPDGKRLATGRMAESSSSFALLDLASGKDLTDQGISENHRIEYQFLGFSPDGKAWGLGEVVSGPSLVGFALIDWVSGKERSRILERGRWRAVLSPDGKVLAGIDSEGKVMLWNADTGKALGSLASRRTDYFGFLAFSPDGKTLANAGFPPQSYGLVRPDDNHAILDFWDVATRENLIGVTLKDAHPDLGMPSSPLGNDWTRMMRFTPDGRRLAIVCRVVLPRQPYAQMVLRIWEVEGGKQVGQFHSQEHGSLRDFALSPDGKTVALAWMGAVVSQGPGEPTTYAPSPVTIVEVATGKEVASLPPTRSGYAAVAFSRDGALLATQDNQGVVKVWERTK
jgi:uncharacterized protein (TIGR03067 family)